MATNWFPGHMRTGLREIEQRINSSDLIIELLDARAPRATQHPMMATLRGRKPILRILNKADLADPHVTKEWIRAFLPDATLDLSLDSDRSPELRKLPGLCRRLLRQQPHIIHAIVVGVPNVGKSTLINRLKGRSVLVARNVPGVTKKGHAVAIDKGFFVWDSPGVLWPDLGDHDQFVRLSAIGTIPDAVLDVHAVAAFVLEELAHRYPESLRRVYDIADVGRPPAALLEDIARRRGHLAPEGRLDTRRSALALIQEFRAGKLGRISIERP